MKRCFWDQEAAALVSTQKGTLISVSEKALVMSLKGSPAKKTDQHNLHLPLASTRESILCAAGD